MSLFTEWRWKLVDNYFKTYGYVRHQLSGFTDFVKHKLPLILKENSDIEIRSYDNRSRHLIKFGKIRIIKPRHQEANGVTIRLLPDEAKTRGLTYNITVHCNIKHIETNHAPIVSLVNNMKGSKPVILRVIVCSSTDATTIDGTTVELRPPLDDTMLRKFIKKRCFVHGFIMLDYIDYINIYDDDAEKQVGDFLMVGEKRVHVRDQVPLFEIPCMVKSEFCNLYQAFSKRHCLNDTGGYFGAFFFCLLVSLPFLDPSAVVMS